MGVGCGIELGCNAGSASNLCVWVWGVGAGGLTVARPQGTDSLVLLSLGVVGVWVIVKATSYTD